MGRRKGRKRRRRRNQESLGAEALRRSENRRRRRRSDDEVFAGALAAAPPDDLRTLAWQEPGPRNLIAMVRENVNPGARPALTCEGCHEFVPGDTGRGRCLHPGSGFVAPWPDTEACQFHEARRRR
ncbi:MAG: hypothetical protein OXG61_01595 [Chloroflexi bacterium]|nr:hypothetical protein [Chloroflexota bacterium]